jgi:hypothetical protein
MDTWSPVVWSSVLSIVAIVGWVTVAVVNSMSRARVREMEVRERIAMIERGLVPAPEVDPNGFDRAMDRYDRVRRSDQYRYRTHGRYRRAGITLMGLGFGFMFMLGFLTGEPRIGLGIGSFLAILGVAFFLNSLFESDPPPPSSGSAASVGSAARPPSN